MKIRIVALILLMLPEAARAGSPFFQFSFGTNSNDFSTRMFAVGYEMPLWGILSHQVLLGAYIDGSQSSGVVGFGSYEIGLDITTPSGIYTKFFIGPGLMTQTDTRISSIPEINTDMEVGLRDTKGSSIGFNYHHISNAGFFPPNLGRDFMGLKVQFSF